MTRTDAEKAVRERWERLGLDWKAAPIMFGMDVDNMLADDDRCQHCGVENAQGLCPACEHDMEERDKDAEAQAAYRKQTGEAGRSVPQYSDQAGGE